MCCFGNSSDIEKSGCSKFLVAHLSSRKKGSRAGGLGLAAASSDLSCRVMSLRCVYWAHKHDPPLLPFFLEDK